LPSVATLESGTERRRNAERSTEGPEKVPKDVRHAFGVSDALRELARDVRRIGRGRRGDAESIAIDKEHIAHELRRLAGRLDRRATP
jgi:hypothetical protein